MLWMTSSTQTRSVPSASSSPRSSGLPVPVCSGSPLLPQPQPGHHKTPPPDRQRLSSALIRRELLETHLRSPRGGPFSARAVPLMQWPEVSGVWEVATVHRGRTSLGRSALSAPQAWLGPSCIRRPSLQAPSSCTSCYQKSPRLQEARWVGWSRRSPGLSPLPSVVVCSVMWPR